MNMRLTLPAAVGLALLLVLSGCSKPAEEASSASLDKALVGAPEGPIVAVVNGENVSQPLLDTFAKGRGLDPADAEQRQQALDSLIENILLAQEGLKSGLAAQSDVQAELALVRMQQLSGRQLGVLRESVDVPEQELVDYYNREVERTGRVEYNVQHLLFEDQASAEAALLEARAEGADFAALMEKYSGSAKQARDLGWGHLAQLPPEFAQLLTELADGEVAPVVVSTRFGFHVIRRVAERPFEPPAFEQVREGVRQQMLGQALADRVRALRAAAQVTAPGASAASPQGQ
jgi:peptidyl-prolyl cis-trans isomerase C